MWSRNCFCTVENVCHDNYILIVFLSSAQLWKKSCAENEAETQRGSCLCYRNPENLEWVAFAQTGFFCIWFYISFKRPLFFLDLRHFVRRWFLCNVDFTVFVNILCLFMNLYLMLFICILYHVQHFDPLCLLKVLKVDWIWIGTVWSYVNLFGKMTSTNNGF